MINRFDENKAFEYENGFYLTSEPYRMGNILAHYELYKKILDIPGDVMELGVFKGGSLLQFCTFRELLENENSRKIVGFDMFGEFPMTSKVSSDMEFIDNWNESFKGEFISESDLYQSLAYKKFENVELVAGDILDTIDDYLKKYPYTQIALLHIDTDVYEPSKAGLEKLYDKVVKNGVVVLDDYATVEGETLAVNEFFADKNVEIKKFPFSHRKPSFIIKAFV